MIPGLADALPMTAGTIGTLVVARWLWRAQAIAAWVRVGAIILGLAALGAVVGVVDPMRAFDLVAGLAGPLTDAIGKLTGVIG